MMIERTLEQQSHMNKPNRRSHVIDKLLANPEWNSELAGSLLMSKFYYQMGI
jgi:hypothetical protein